MSRRQDYDSKTFRPLFANSVAADAKDSPKSNDSKTIDIIIDDDLRNAV